MKDIKSLYLTAKSSGKQADISAYTEAIQELINDNPNDYITHLEYIISSDIGLQTLKPFIEKNGFPIMCYDRLIESLNECIRKCDVYGKNKTPYTEMVSYFENWKLDHLNCFMMFENYRGDLDDKYVKTYYSRNNKGIQNRKLVAGMISKFGECAIPDALITADLIDGSAVKTVLEYVHNTESLNTSTMCEWMNRITAENIQNIEESVELIEFFEENCLTSKVNKIIDREDKVFKESMIMCDDTMEVEYTESDIQNIQDLISFKEYEVLWGDEFTEKESYSHQLQSEIYSLYEMMDGVINEDDSLISESLAIKNTRNKKTGEIPGYLISNHDIGYGEDERSKKKEDTNGDSDQEPTLDDYRRPSASNDDSGAAPLNLPSAFDNTDDTRSSVTSNDTNRSGSNDLGSSEDDRRMINNYYYYTYNNSHNKNTNSFNKDNSVRDNHSSSTVSNRTDKSSSVIHSNSHNKNNSEYNLGQSNNDDDEEPEKKSDSYGENQEPWKLNIFTMNEIFTEEMGNTDRPKSDHPVKDILTDIDRVAVKGQQEAKKKVQDIQNAGKAVMKPINRSKSWINRIIADWKDKDENALKEKMADPHARSNLFSAFSSAVKAGAILKASILINPLIGFLAITKKHANNKRMMRIRNEIISELKTEISILDEKIKDLNYKGGSDGEKYKLMRFKNELNKKLIRVGGTKAVASMV